MPHTTEPKDGSFYDSDYFLHGKESGKSNYQDYGWLADQTIALASFARRHMGIKDQDTVLDYGCSRGYFVKALRMLGVNAKGYDHAEWPIQNCDEYVKGHVSNDLTLLPLSVDHIWSKDVMEHLSIQQVEDILPQLCAATRKSILIIVPLTSYFGGKYLREEDESDPSHVIRFTLDDWLKFFSGLAKDFAVYGSYHLHGLKPASSQVPHSCGFFKLSRI